MNEEPTGNIVRYTHDPLNPVQLTAAEKERLNAMRDDQIDFSDIPDQSQKTGWYHPNQMTAEELQATRERAREKHTHLKMDPDIARYFRETGTSAERINGVLRAYVEAQRKSA